MLERVADVMLRAQPSVPCATAWAVGPGGARRQRGDGHPAADSPMSDFQSPEVLESVPLVVEARIGGSMSSLVRAPDYECAIDVGADPDLNPPAYLDIHDSTMRIRADWPGWGRSEVQIAAETSGRASSPIAPRQFSDILECASETVILRLPFTAG